MKISRAEAAFLVVMLGLMFAGCWPWMNTLGVEYDEAHFLPAAASLVRGSPERMKLPDGLYLFHRPFPFMTMPYLGSFDSYVYALSFGAFGLKPIVSRATNLVWGMGVVVLAYFLARRLGGRAVAVVTLLLLVSDLEFLLHVPPHFGPFLLQMTCGMAALLLLHRWLGSGRERDFLWAAFLLGLGFTEKLTFVWFVFMLALGIACLYRTQFLRRITRRQILLGALAFLAGCLPVVWYTLGRPEIIFGFGRSSAGLPTNWFQVIFDRLDRFWLLMGGQWTMQLRLGDVPADLNRFSATFWAFWVGLLALAALAIAARKHAIDSALKPPRAAWLVYFIVLGIVLLNVFFPEGGRVHHLLLTYPFAQIAIAISTVWLVELVRAHRTVLGVVFGIAAAGTLVAGGFSTIQNLNWYTTEVARTGGRLHWSAKINELIAWMDSKPESHYIICAWGIQRQAYTFGRGDLSLSERYFEVAVPNLAPENRQNIHALLRRRNTVWVFSGMQPAFVEARAKVTALAAEIGLYPMLVKQFIADRDASTLYDAYEFHPHGGGTQRAPQWQAVALDAVTPVAYQTSPAAVDRAARSATVRAKTDGGAGSHALGIEIALKPPANHFRFRVASGSWDYLTELRVELVSDKGDVIARWTRPFEWFPMIRREESFEFGERLYPDYFWASTPGTGPGARVRIIVEGTARGRNWDLTISELEADAAGGYLASNPMLLTTSPSSR